MNRWSQVLRRYPRLLFRLLFHFPTTVRQIWNSLHAPNVPVAAKLLFLASLFYILFPLDAVPDILPILGYSDDLLLLLAATEMLLRHGSRHNTTHRREQPPVRQIPE